MLSKGVCLAGVYTGQGCMLSRGVYCAGVYA